MLLFLTVACTRATPPEPTAMPPASSFAAADTLVLRFHDSSVPPPDHRSWVITSTPTQIRKVVDSYGDIVSDDTVPQTAADFQKHLAALEQAGIKAAKPKDQERGCTGGTGRSLTVSAAGTALLEGRVNRCGGAESGDLEGDLGALASVLNAPFKGMGLLQAP